MNAALWLLLFRGGTSVVEETTIFGASVEFAATRKRTFEPSRQREFAADRKRIIERERAQ